MASFFVPPGAHNGRGLPLAGAPCPINATTAPPLLPFISLTQGQKPVKMGYISRNMRRAIILLAITALLPALLCGETAGRRPGFLPSELNTNSIEVPQEYVDEKDLLLEFVKGYYLPERINEFTEEEAKAYVQDSTRHLLKVLEKCPDSEGTARRLVSLCLVSDETAGWIVQELGKLVEKGVTSYGIETGIASILLDDERYDEAAPFLRTLQEKYPDDEMVLYLTSGYYANMGDFAALDEVLARAKKAGAKIKYARMELLRIMRRIQKGEEDEAETDAAMLGITPDFHRDPLQSLLDTWKYIQPTGDWKIVSDLTAAILMSDFDKLEEEGCAYDAARNSIFAALNAGDYAGAGYVLSFLKKINTPSLRRRIFCALADLANEFTKQKFKDKETPKALVMLNIQAGEMALSTVPVGDMARDGGIRALAEYLVAAGELERYMEVTEGLKEPTPLDTLLRAFVLVDLDRAQEALPTLRSLRDRFGDGLPFEFYNALGEAERRCGNMQEAEDSFRKALELNPEDDVAANYLGYTMAEEGRDLDEARRLIEIALRANPDSISYLDSMAWVQFKRGDYQDALKFMVKTTTLAKQDPDTNPFLENDEYLTHMREILQAIGCDYLAEFFQ